MIKLVQTIGRFLEQGEDLVLATILSQVGSTPRTVGAKMIVRSDGTGIGTIGGGLLEAQVIKRAAEAYEAAGTRIYFFDLTSTDAASTDMICGGRLEVLLEFLQANPANLDLFKEFHSALENREKGYLVTALGDARDAFVQVGRCLVLANATLRGHLPFPESALDAIKEKIHKTRYPSLISLEGQYFFVEPCLMPGTAYILGAGHVSKQTAFLASMVGFRTVVMDDREEFANRERFPQAAEVRVLPSFEDCFSALDIDEDSYVVILTRGHLHDRVVLSQALKTEAGYIGMIGSERKRETVYQALIREGFAREDLKKVHCPIGLSIEAETPEEIAVSIVAELIQARAKKS
jgi:xanthine dehydrogenase accessory factor